jgi:DNA-binding MarR family transcriptional regulator
LTALAGHLALPKSSASVLIKDPARPGFVRRVRDSVDERRLALTLTAKGRRRVQADTVLRPDALAAALAALPHRRRQDLLAGMEALADSASRPTA